jgi:hypothetical protein
MIDIATERRLAANPSTDPGQDYWRGAPGDLCPEHRRIWIKWQRLRYDIRRPKDWPGQMMMDNRTSHQDRARHWYTKNLEQMALTEEICRSGRSPQCSRG